MLKVGLEGGAMDKDVIEVNDDTDFEEVAEDVIHGGLECGRGVGESKGHYKELAVPKARTKCGLVGVLLADADLVEATAEVNFGKVFGSTKVEPVVDEGGGVDDVLAERADDVLAERAVDVDEGRGGTQAEMVETDVLMSSMDDWRDVIMRKRAARSMAASGASVCSPVRLRAMLSTESVRMPDISMLDDWAMVVEEAVVAAAEELAADDMEATAAAAASTTAR
ncbi:hypothetical protein CBR_g42086 [Chara braunii]|uniref:Uncharacterized protein n=1 Tax=Chara braunii TaxID=69332 RepID=A0A388LX18_CHABU|nr:hypothetical protein CBR_g42086 [Chara braunii]|eukprot:GBG86803.1 hypothetical protein CBR_g42086 [Chara braunii]